MPFEFRGIGVRLEGDIRGRVPGVRVCAAAEDTPKPDPGGVPRKLHCRSRPPWSEPRPPRRDVAPVFEVLLAIGLGEGWLLVALHERDDCG